MTALLSPVDVVIALVVYTLTYRILSGKSGVVPAGGGPSTGSGRFRLGTFRVKPSLTTFHFRAAEALLLPGVILGDIMLDELIVEVAVLGDRPCKANGPQAFHMAVRKRDIAHACMSRMIPLPFPVLKDFMPS